MKRWFLGAASVTLVGCTASYNQVFAPVQTNNIATTGVTVPGVISTAAPNAAAPSPPVPEVRTFQPRVFKGTNESGLMGPMWLPKGPLKVYAKHELDEGDLSAIFRVELMDEEGRSLDIWRAYLFSMVLGGSVTRTTFVKKDGMYFFDVYCEGGRWLFEIGGEGAAGESEEQGDVVDVEPIGTPIPVPSTPPTPTPTPKPKPSSTATPPPIPSPTATPFVGPAKFQKNFNTSWYSPNGDDRAPDLRNVPEPPPGYVLVKSIPHEIRPAGSIPDVGDPVTVELFYEKKS